MKKAVYLMAVVMLAGTASSVFTTFESESYRETQTLRQSFEINLGYSENDSYRVELQPVTGGDVQVELPRTEVTLNGSEPDRTVLMPSGNSLSVEALDFTATISPDTLKRNHSFSINVNVRPSTESSSGVAPEVIHQRTLDYTLYTSADQVRENRIESNEYSGQVLEFNDEGEVVENETVSETEIKIEDSTENSSQTSVKGETQEDSGSMTYILAGLIFLTSLVIVREVIE